MVTEFKPFKIPKYGLTGQPDSVVEKSYHICSCKNIVEEDAGSRETSACDAENHHRPWTALDPCNASDPAVTRRARQEAGC